MWTVTRQRQWPEGNNVVEISSGGIDYCNPDALAAKYEGEFEEYEDPREAVNVAIAIAKAWQSDAPSETVEIGYGATGGFTMPFDGQELSEETFADLHKWAEEKWEALDKCENCSAILGKQRFGDPDIGEFDCCSENCAEQRWFSPDEDYEGNDEILAQQELEDFEQADEYFGDFGE